ncbi:MAG: single-stranded-DNA-specific exonuclease RecJ [Phycisphaerales bacterium]
MTTTTDTPTRLRGLRCGWTLRGREASGGSLAQRLMAARGIDPAEQQRYLKAGLPDLRAARELPGATDAATLILDHARAGRRIVVLGDYDVDGTASAATLRHTLRAVVPAVDLVIEIPHRADGYGLTDDAVARVLGHRPSLVITVDCGITAVDQVGALRAAGAQVVVIDHHALRPDGVLPPASVIAHPQRPDAAYGNPDLCACAVTWKVCCEIMRLVAGDSMNTALRQRLAMLLPLAAVASVADVIPIHGETRIIIRQGLEWFRSTDLPGLRMVAERIAEVGKVRSQGVAFGIAPVLNAAGRMGHAGACAELLGLAADEPHSTARAREIVDELKKLNAERRMVQERVSDAVLARIEHAGLDHGPPTAVVLADADWPHALVGIVAAKVIERTGRPALLGHVQPDGRVKCSGRSVPGWDIGAAIGRCAAWLESGGGHPMAAGATVRAGAFEEFAAALRADAAAALAGRSLQASLQWDARASVRELDCASIDALQACGPFGQANPTPAFLFEGCRLASDARHMNPGKPHLRVDVAQDGARLGAVWFNSGELAERLRRGVPCSVLAEVSVNEWNGRRTPELVVRDISLD